MNKFFEHPSTKILAAVIGLFITLTVAFGSWAYESIVKDISRNCDMKVMKMEGELKEVMNQTTASFALLLQEYRLTNQHRQMEFEELKIRLEKIESKLH